MKKVWNIYKNGFLLGVQEGVTSDAYQRLKTETGSDLKGFEYRTNEIRFSNNEGMWEAKLEEVK